MKVLIIVPAHNEEKNLPTLIPKIEAMGWDCLVINDASTDHTGDVLDEMGVPHLDLTNNVGLAGVTRMGFMYAWENGYDCAMVVDGDGQHPPKYIKLLIDKIEEGYDYVIGSRFVNKPKDRSLRMIGSRLICAAIKLKTGKTVTDPTSGMRALGKSVLEDFAESMNFIAEPDALTHVIHSGHKFTEVQVEMEERTAGVSYFSNIFRSAYFMFDVLMSILFMQ